MRVSRYYDAAVFARRVMPMLMRQETVNHLMLGILAGLESGLSNPSPDPPLLCAVESDAGEPIALAVSTGASLVLTDMTAQATDALLKFLGAEKIKIPMASGPLHVVGDFSKSWAERNGLTAELWRRLRIMRLDVVESVTGVSGNFRAAVMGDTPTLTPWADAFTKELKLETSQGGGRAEVERRIGQNRLFVWCDPQPVSMAACAGPTPRGIRINFVYTPAEFRRHGYASACVASLSQRMLDEGKKFVFLYVEAGNPTTNRIYQAVGYRPVCDWEDYRFHPSS